MAKRVLCPGASLFIDPWFFGPRSTRETIENLKQFARENAEKPWRRQKTSVREQKRENIRNNRLIIIADRAEVLPGFPVEIQDVGSISWGDNSFHLSFVSFSLWLGDYLQRTSGRPTIRYALRIRCSKPTTRFDERAFDLHPTFDRKRRLLWQKSARCFSLSPTLHFLSLSRDRARYWERNSLTFWINQPMR